MGIGKFFVWPRLNRGPQIATDVDVNDVHTLKAMLAGIPGVSMVDGSIPGLTSIVKFGRNDNVGTTEEDLWINGGTYTGWLTAASAVRVKAGGDAADDAAGAGARKIMVEGLDENWEIATEEITLAGASVSSPTSITFIRVYRAWVTDVGTYGGDNEAAVLIETTGGALVANIEAGKGQTQLSMYTVPAGKTAYVLLARTYVAGNKNADVFFWQRQDADVTSAPFTGKRMWHPIDQVQGPAGGDHPIPHVFPAKTDIWASAVGPSGGAAVSTRMFIALLDAA